VISSVLLGVEGCGRGMGWLVPMGMSNVICAQCTFGGVGRLLELILLFLCIDITPFFCLKIYVFLCAFDGYSGVQSPNMVDLLCCD
jgi:hypothetical protein